MDENTELRNKAIHKMSTDLQKKKKKKCAKNTQWGKDSHLIKNETGPITYTIYKNELEVDQRQT